MLSVIIFTKFSEKLHEMEKILVRMGGGGALAGGTQFVSATGAAYKRCKFLTSNREILSLLNLDILILILTMLTFIWNSIWYSFDSSPFYLWNKIFQCEHVNLKIINLHRSKMTTYM